MVSQKIEPEQFLIDLKKVLADNLADVSKCKMVVGPGRSGAIAAAYASHLLGIPFLAYGQRCPESMQPLLIIDTAKWRGRTLRKIKNKYDKMGIDNFVVWVYNEPPIVRFWYEGIYTRHG